MRKRSVILFALVFVAAFCAGRSAGDEAKKTPTIAEKTAGAEKKPGYFNLYWDAKQGKL